MPAHWGSTARNGSCWSPPITGCCSAAARVQALFNTPEVLVAAGDLANGRTILPDATVREVTYIHLMLANHQVLWANGVETESFHPVQRLAHRAERHADRARLFQSCSRSWSAIRCLTAPMPAAISARPRPRFSPIEAA